MNSSFKFNLRTRKIDNFFDHPQVVSKMNVHPMLPYAVCSQLDPHWTPIVLEPVEYEYEDLEAEAETLLLDFDFDFDVVD